MGSAEETAASTLPPKQPPSANSPAHPPSTSQPPAPATSQEPPATPAYSVDWATAVQAYYTAGAAAAAAGGGPPPPFYSPPVWGSQMMSPYGTPIPYSPMYHPVYAHPSVATAPGYQAAESVSNKSKGVSGGGGGPVKSGDGGKVTSRSADDYGSQSGGESGSEGSSDTGENGTEGQDAGRKRSFGEAFTEGESSQPITAAPNNGTTADSSYRGRQRTVSKLPVSAPGRATIPGPATNLNIGMDVWGASHVGSAPKVRPISANVAAAAAVGANGVMTEHHWRQDERELKRERRKQSNRESARRSRLRKQQECEDLARKVTELDSENSALKVELEQLNKVCKDLEAENASITEELSRMAKTGLASDFEGINCNSSNPAQAVAGEGGGHVPQNLMGSNGQAYNPSSI